MTLAKAYLGNIALFKPSGWTRPPQWLALGDSAESQGFWGIHRINPEGNLLALTASGDYTVDWGDGAISGGMNTANLEHFSAGATASHSYDWNDVSEAGEPQLNYRHVRVTIVPRNGNNLTAINLAVVYPLAGLNTDYSTGWLEIAVNGPNLASISVASGLSNVRHRCMESAVFHSIGSVTSLAHLLSNCNRLQKVVIESTTSVTSINNMFQNCTSLRIAPWLDTSNCVNASSAFSGCSSLLSVPLMNLNKATSLGSMFSNCTSLREIGALQTASAANTSYMFANCPSLVAAPVMTTTSVTDAFGMFSSCLGLYEVPQISLAAAGNPTVTQNIKNLVRFRATGMRESFSIAGMRLSASALDEVYANLAQVVGKTISVGGNYGTSSHNPSIATSKGWTVAV